MDLEKGKPTYEQLKLECEGYFMEELTRFSGSAVIPLEPIRFVVPKQMLLAKRSAYTPQSGLFLGLNRRKSPETEEGRMVTQLKAKWATAYLRRRRRRRRREEANAAAVSDISWSVKAEWESFVHCLGMTFPHHLECFELGFRYVPSTHKSQLQNVLATDALFVALYLLQMAGELSSEHEFTMLASDPQFKFRSQYFWNDLFLLENQIPWTILRAVFTDFCSPLPVGHEDPSVDLSRKAVHVALQSRVKELFRFGSAFVHPSKKHLPKGEYNFVRQLEEAYPNWVPCHLLDYLLGFICLEPISTGWANTWAVNPASVHDGHPYSSIHRTGFFEITSGTVDLDSSRPKLLEQFQEQPPAGRDPEDEEADARRVLLELEEAGLDGSAARRPSWRNFARTVIEVIRLAREDWDLLLDPSHQVSRIFPSRNSLTPLKMLERAATFVTWVPCHVELRVARFLMWPLPFVRGVENLKTFLLMLSVAISTRQVLIKALGKVNEADVGEARVKRCALILPYFQERAALMRRLHQELHPSDGARFTDPSNYWEQFRPGWAVMVQVLLEALVARPPVDPYYAEAIMRALPAAFKKKRTDQGWPIVVLNSDPLAFNNQASTDQAVEEDKWHIDSAKTLADAGLRLGRCYNLQQIDMESTPKACLRLPQLSIYEGTEPLIRNLAAWERIKGADEETPFASFIKLMDNLIDTAEDVVVLKKARIIDHHLASDKAVADMWNELAVGLRFCPSERWTGVLWKVNKLAKSRKRKLWAQFKRKYWAYPWSVAALGVATVLLLLTIAQTIFGALQIWL